MAKQGEFNAAEQEFQTAIGIDPQMVEAYTSLGMVETKMGRGKEAVENFRKVVALQPDSADAHLNLGIALVDQYDRKAGFE
jgi:Tfp pilus assembly protein PilF